MRTQGRRQNNEWIEVIGENIKAYGVDMVIRDRLDRGKTYTNSRIVRSPARDNAEDKEVFCVRLSGVKVGKH